MVELQCLESPDSFILHCNKLAMERLHSDQPAEALSLLQRAEEQLSALPPSAAARKLRAITLNNIGCYYKRVAQGEKALEYLEAALEIDVSNPSDKTNLAGTHLNLSALKSQSGHHKAALSHCQAALHLLKGCPIDLSPALLTTLVVANHSAGVEYEHLGMLQNAVDVYREGVGLARDKLGADHPLTISLLKSYYGAIDNLDRSVFQTKSKRARYVSVTPIPAKSEGFHTCKKGRKPRRSASKGVYEKKKGKSVSSPGYAKSGELLRSDGEEGGWMERRTMADVEYRLKPVPPRPRKVHSGVQLQPLEFLPPVSKQSRRDKSFSAPEQKPLTALPLPQPPKTSPGKAGKAKFRHLEVVNIISDEAVPQCPPPLPPLPSLPTEVTRAMQVYQARKEGRRTKKEERGTVEKRAQAAIEALERLKKEAAEETGLGVPRGPKSKPPPRALETNTTASCREGKEEMSVERESREGRGPSE